MAVEPFYRNETGSHHLIALFKRRLLIINIKALTKRKEKLKVKVNRQTTKRNETKTLKIEIEIENENEKQPETNSNAFSHENDALRHCAISMMQHPNA